MSHEVTVRPLRPDQARQFARVADALRRLDDDELGDVKLRLMELLRNSLEAGHQWADPIPQAFCAVSDLATVEINHRLAVIWNTDADMRGGHKVIVTNDLEETGTFQAACWPIWDDPGGGSECWTGPPRATVEEAVEDARRHNPGFEPDDHVMLQGDDE